MRSSIMGSTRLILVFFFCGVGRGLVCVGNPVLFLYRGGLCVGSCRCSIFGGGLCSSCRCNLLARCAFLALASICSCCARDMVVIYGGCCCNTCGGIGR